METQNEFNVESLPHEKLWGDMILCQMNDFWFPRKYVPNIVRVLNEFKPLPNDIILASFPKTGTTWLKSLLFSIINRSSKESLLVNHHPHNLVPFLELQIFASSPDVALINNNHDHDNEEINPNRRRIFGTHIPYQLLGKTLDNSCKVVYVTRNPKDTLVSMWHFLNKLKIGEEDGLWSIEEAQNNFCSGITPFGSYYDHVMGFKKASLEKTHNIFFITYEELMADTKVQVMRLAEFLGCPFDEGKEEEILEVEKIVKGCSFDMLVSHEVNKSEDFASWFPVPYSSFYRKGGIGDHKNYLDANTIERIDALTRDKFHANGFIYGI